MTPPAFGSVRLTAAPTVPPGAVTAAVTRARDYAIPAQAGASVPRHVAIIMDGNGRWGVAHGQPRLAGHVRGVEAAREAVAGAIAQGVEVLSLYAFSTLNWRRPIAEVEGLMALLEQYLSAEAPALAEQGIRLRFLGDRAPLPAAVRAAADRAEALGVGQTRLTLNLGVNYGGQEELVLAVRDLAREVAGGRLAPEQLDAPRLEARLFTHGLPPVDLLVRTAGERRLSNFLLWQSAYAELLFMEVLWPDFTRADFAAALEDFARRRRTFGGLGEGRPAKS